MNKERERHWLSILRISGKMRELAHSLQWRDLAQLENNRRQLIKSFFAQPVEIEDADTVSEGINRILDIDQQIIFLSRKHRGQMRGELVDFRKHKNTIFTYKSQSR